MTEMPPNAPVKTWMPTASGILIIIAGATNILKATSGIILRGMAFRALPGLFTFGAIGIGSTFISFVLGIVALIGGIYALRRQVWWLALLGAISASILPLFLGIPATIPVSMSKQEFK